MRFRGREDADEWHECELVSRAGRATGKYTLAWNILRDSAIENVDFERDVGAYEVLPRTHQDSAVETRANNSPGSETSEGIALSAADQAAHAEGATERMTFDDEDMEAHLGRLLQAAEDRETSNSRKE